VLFKLTVGKRPFKCNCDINIERQKKGTAWKIKKLIFQTSCELVPQGKSEGA
jgi:hypothetical protein